MSEWYIFKLSKLKKKNRKARLKSFTSNTIKTHKSVMYSHDRRGVNQVSA